MNNKKADKVCLVRFSVSKKKEFLAFTSHLGPMQTISFLFEFAAYAFIFNVFAGSKSMLLFATSFSQVCNLKLVFKVESVIILSIAVVRSLALSWSESELHLNVR